MTKEITKAIILQQIQDKFKLREFEPAKFLLDETVVPIYDIGQHLMTWDGLVTQVSITAAPANYKFFTVPSDERWELRGYNIVFMAAGAYKVTGAYILRKSGVHIYLDMKLAQTVSYAINLPESAKLEPGDEVYVYVDDYTSTAALRMYIDYKKEELR